MVTAQVLEIFLRVCLPMPRFWRLSGVHRGDKCFRRLGWKDNLGFRHLGQHSRCDVCAILFNLRREHPVQRKSNNLHQHDNRRVGYTLGASERTSRTPKMFLQWCIERVDWCHGTAPTLSALATYTEAKMRSTCLRPTIHTKGLIV